MEADACVVPVDADGTLRPSCAEDVVGGSRVLLRGDVGIDKRLDGVARAPRAGGTVVEARTTGEVEAVVAPGAVVVGGAAVCADQGEVVAGFGAEIRPCRRVRYTRSRCPPSVGR